MFLCDTKRHSPLVIVQLAHRFRDLLSVGLRSGSIENGAANGGRPLWPSSPFGSMTARDTSV